MTESQMKPVPERTRKRAMYGSMEYAPFCQNITRTDIDNMDLSKYHITVIYNTDLSKYHTHIHNMNISKYHTHRY